MKYDLLIRLLTKKLGGQHQAKTLYVLKMRRQ